MLPDSTAGPFSCDAQLYWVTIVIFVCSCHLAWRRLLCSCALLTSVTENISSCGCHIVSPLWLIMFSFFACYISIFTSCNIVITSLCLQMCFSIWKGFHIPSSWLISISITYQIIVSDSLYFGAQMQTPLPFEVEPEEPAAVRERVASWRCHLDVKLSLELHIMFWGVFKSFWVLMYQPLLALFWDV